MKKISDFLSAYRHAIIWTIWYIVFMWAVLYFLFNFCMFSIADWTRLWHAHLRGFPGFVFGLLILAAAPLYVATTGLIIRTGKPLINLPMPKAPKIFAAPPPPAPEPAPAPKPEVEPVNNMAIKLPDGVPNEMRGAFMRARRNIEITGIKPAAPKPQPAPVAIAATEQESTLPLPTDFDMPDDFDIPTGFSDGNADAPVFKDISFDSTPNDTAAPQSNNDSAPIHTSELVNQLTALGCNATTDGDIIITDKFAIAIHDDDDFWIADEQIWFAAGKSKPSPVVAATSAAEKHGLRAALYLGAKNIMDLDGHIATWTARNIHIAHTPDELV